MPDYLQRESNKITIANFYEGYELKKYNFEPPYQRRSLWTEEKKSFLIDSIMKNYPIPPIFLHQKIDDATGKTSYDVIDGKQRLTAITEFIENEIPVSDELGEALEDSPIAGRLFEEFDDEELVTYKSRFWRYAIPIEYVDTGAQEVIDSIFDRLNRNGEPLTGQELRNSSYYDTSLLKLVSEMSNSRFWKDRLSIVDRTRMEEIEFLSELAFLILEGKELHANQMELDRLYEKYAENSNIDYIDLKQKFTAISNYMDSLRIDYDARKIRGVSHLYGLFAFSHYCIEQQIASESVIPPLNSFFDLWQTKYYDDENVKKYKESMSARTKDRGQRKKRMKALVDSCIEIC